MIKSEVTYDDRFYRQEAKTLWSTFTDDTLKDGPYKGIDLVSDDYDIEVAYTTIPFNKKKEFRLEQRKLKYWYKDRTAHYIVFNKDATECNVWANSNIRKWIDIYPVEYRHCNGWAKRESFFLIIPLDEYVNMKFYNNTNGGWK
jgi:hypothetical protein